MKARPKLCRHGLNLNFCLGCRGKDKRDCPLCQTRMTQKFHLECGWALLQCPACRNVEVISPDDRR